MTWVAAGIAGASLVGGLFGASSSKKAAKAQLQADQLAAQTQMRMFDTANANMAPWRTQGQTALSALMGGMGIGPEVAGGPASGSLTKSFDAQDLAQWQDPGYKFRLDQGLGALQNSQAATSGLVSGNALRSIMDYGQNAASQEYQNAFDRYTTNQNNIYNRLSNISGLGENAAANTGNMAINTGQSVGSTQMAGGAAQAAGYMGQANAISGAVNNAVGGYLGYKYLNK